MATRFPVDPERPRIVLSDFDGTIAHTSEPSPAGIDVERAVGIAVQEVLGPDGAAIFRQQGGLQNRAPVELMADLLPGLSTAELDRLTQRFNAAKLGVLSGEIGTTFSDGSVWPRPVDGFFDFLTRLEGGSGTGLAIISSGHHSFIGKVLDLWGLVGRRRPRVFSEELARATARKEGIPLTMLAKPNGHLMNVVLQGLASGLGGNTQDRVEVLRGGTVYVGDDPIKDGGLAHNSGVGFVHIRPENSRESWESVLSILGGRALADVA